MVVWRSPPAAGGTCGQAQGSLGAPSGEAEAWRNPGRGCTLVQVALADLGEAFWMTLFFLLELWPLGRS